MARKRRSSNDAETNLKVVSKNSRSRKKPAKTKPRHRIARALIFLFIAGITGISVYVVTNPDVVTKTEDKPVYIAPAPSPAAPAVRLESATVELFFSDPDSDLLVRERRNVVWKAGDAETQIRAILTELWHGSRSEMLTPVPNQVVVREVSIKNEVVTVNFSKELVQNHPGGTLAEMHTIYAIVNSVLLNMPKLKKVRILVEGKPPETLKGHIDCRTPFTANLSIVKKS